MGAKHDVVIVGAGQAGLAASYWLREHGREHVILERGGVGERWRSERWDSLHLQFPNSYLQLPGRPYAGPDPAGFAHHPEVRRRLEDYGEFVAAPVLRGVDVEALGRDDGSGIFTLATTRGPITANAVILATGPFQRSLVPGCATAVPAGLRQLTASEYRNPAQLPPGGVLIVGSGSSGCQIADELREAGRTVYLAVGRHRRAPHRYRGRLTVDWFRDIGGFEVGIDDLPERRPPPPIVVTGVKGGYSIDVRGFAKQGMVLLGRLLDIEDGIARFDGDLAERLADADRAALGLLQRIDAYIGRAAINAPDPDFVIPAAPPLESLPRTVDLRAQGISTVLWCLGYAHDYGWVRLPIIDAHGEPQQRRGVTACPGAYFLGLHWMHTFKSGTFYGVGEDAKYLVEHLVRG